MNSLEYCENAIAGWREATIGEKILLRRYYRMDCGGPQSSRMLRITLDLAMYFRETADLPSKTSFPYTL